MKKPSSARKSTRPAFRPLLESLEARLTPTTYTVSSLADAGAGSLRAAITSANGDHTGDTIDFSVAGVIKLTSGALPTITDPGAVNINGATAPGFADTPVVEIDNNGFAGITVFGSMESLSIVNAKGPGVTLYGTVAGNYIGLALDGSVAANTGVGLLVPGGSVNNTIGGTTAADRNVISGNGAGGIQISGQAIVEGNFIGTDTTGQAARVGNQGNGITITLTQFSSIGGIVPGAGNTIAYNSGYGVVVDTGLANAISENSIFHNGAGGIFLVNGGNLNQAAPVLNSAFKPTPTTIEVSGTLSVVTGIEQPGYVVQIFATPAGTPAGQGQDFIGSLIVYPNASGFTSFVFRTTYAAASGTTFTATATGPMSQGENINDTSAFSSAIPLTVNANAVFVLNAYQLLLNRAPDPGSAVWVNALNIGATPASVVLGIERSPEYLSDQVFILYNRYLGRNPDASGGLAWTNFLLAGGTLEQVAEGLVSSAEYFVDQGGTDLGYVTGLYEDVLNRAPGKSELIPWQAAFDAGASRFGVAVGFLTSQEYRTDLVQDDYTTFLLRAADPVGLATWVNALNAGYTDQLVLASIFGSAEGYQLWS